MSTGKAYNHDCERCYYLGNFKNHDLYFCDESVIARYGNLDHEYKSLLCKVLENVPEDFEPKLWEAKRRKEKINSLKTLMSDWEDEMNLDVIQGSVSSILECDSFEKAMSIIESVFIAGFNEGYEAV